MDTVDSTCQQYVNDSKLNIESLVEENYKEDKLDFVRQAEICASLFEKYGIATHRALHIGCGIDSGRLTFQLTKHFDEVSHSFIAFLSPARRGRGLLVDPGLRSTSGVTFSCGRKI